MTKRELVVAVAERLGYTQNEVASVVQAALDTVTECLAERQRLEIRNFGVFEVKKRDARIGRNPRTGQEVSIAEKFVATFKPGKALKEYVEGVGPKPTMAEAGAPEAPPAAPAGGDVPRGSESIL
ncbi:MAG: integration host factor subunit beta [Nitrospiraceae bacterium]|nr:integration host factor subunit beta [Nitrospiraceae bacterium]